MRNALRIQFALPPADSLYAASTHFFAVVTDCYRLSIHSEFMRSF